MPTLTEGIYATESLISEANGGLAREAVTIRSGQNLSACAVLGTVITGGTITSAAKSGGNTGNGTFVLDGVTPIQPLAQLGVYSLRCIATAVNGGTFRLESPTGQVLGDFVLAAGTVTVSEQIRGVITDGSTDFALGDGFDITVTAIVEKEVALNPTGTDGSQFASGILYGAVNATSGDQRGVAFKRNSEHNGDIVVWPAGITTAQRVKAIADLRARNIILRF